MQAKWQKTNHPGVFVRHEIKRTPDGPKPCPAYDGKRCRCNPKYRGEVWNATTKRPDKQSPVVPNVNEAIGWVADYRRGVEAPASKNLSGILVTDFLDTFLDAMRAGTARRKDGKAYASRTADLYERDLKLHTYPHVEGKTVDAMDAPAWQLVADKITLTGARDRFGNQTGALLASSSVNTILAPVRAAFRWGSAPGRRIVASDPMRDVAVPTGEKSKRKNVAAPEEIPTLLAALTGRISKRGFPINPSLRVAWAIMFYSGLRVSEVVALDWPDIELTRDGGWITVGRTKSEAGTNRRVPIVGPLARILNAWRAECDGARLGPVLPGHNGFRVGMSSVNRTPPERWKKMGLPIFSPHEARHTFASAMIANRDVSLADLQEWLGHASLETTAIYVQTLPGARSETVHARIAGTFGA